MSGKPVTISKTLSGLKFMQRAAEQKKLIEQEKEAVHDNEDDEKAIDDKPAATSLPQAPCSSTGPDGPMTTAHQSVQPKCKIVYERAPGSTAVGRFSIGPPKVREEGGGGGEDPSAPRPDSHQGKKRSKGEAPAAEVSDVEMAELAFQRGPQKGPGKRQKA